MTFKEKLKNKLSENGYGFNEEKIDRLSDFYHMMVEKNKVMNLTAITQEDEVIEKHYIDSLSCSKIVSMDEIQSCIDIGTGAGFPGIPLKIMYPEIRFTLVDSLNKRIRFLEETCEKLELTNIDMIHGRAESLGRNPELREKFDLCVSRAVAKLSVLCEYCCPFVRQGGIFVSYKSKKTNEEVKDSEHALKELGCKIVHIENIRYNGLDRSLIEIKKVRKTPRKYPRREGIPAKDPL